MCIDRIVNNGFDDADKNMILLMNRLDSENWNYDGMKIKMGEVYVFDDTVPDAPVLMTDTDSLRDIDMGEVELFVSARHGQCCKCPECGRTMNVSKWVSTRYHTAPILGMKASLCVRVPQFMCKDCKLYHKLHCPAVVKDHTYTKMLKFEVLRTLSKETVGSTATMCGIGQWIVYDILNQTVSDGLESQDLSNVSTIFLDEIQSTNGQNYVTMAADQDHRMICGVMGNDANSVEMVRDWLVARGGDPDNIEFISCDMSAAYRSGIKQFFPKAKIIIDIFHLDKMVAKALDDSRKRINKELRSNGEEPIKNIKYTLLHRKKNQNGIHNERMKEIRLHNPELALSFDLKEEFFSLFDICMDRKEARSAFFRWFNHCRGSHIPEMTDVADRMLVRLNDILRCFDHRITNAVAEGLNNIYKKIKSAAFGYKNIWNLINMCLFRKGRLSIII